MLLVSDLALVAILLLALLGHISVTFMVFPADKFRAILVFIYIAITIMSQFLISWIVREHTRQCLPSHELSRVKNFTSILLKREPASFTLL